MSILLTMFGFAGVFLIGAFRLLRGAPDQDDTHPDAAAQGAAYIGLASVLVGAIAWYPLVLSGLLLILAPLPVLLGAYALAIARKPLTAVVGAIDYTLPLVIVWAVFRKAM